MRVILMVAAAFVLAASPAMAENFTGPRAEVRLGLDMAGSDLWEKFDYNDGYYRMSDDRGFHTADAGFNYGLGAGYDLTIGERVIAGVEATLDFSTAKNCISDFYRWDDFCLKAGRDIGLGVRAGAVVTPGTLLFVKAGYANARIKMTAWDLPTSRTFSESKKRDGLRIGGGIEAMLSSKVYLKAEYSYTDYSSWEDHFEERYIVKYAARFGFDRHKTLVAVGIRF